MNCHRLPSLRLSHRPDLFVKLLRKITVIHTLSVPIPATPLFFFLINMPFPRILFKCQAVINLGACLASVLRQPCLHERPCPFGEMRSELRLHAPPPASIQQLWGRNGFGGRQCDNGTGIWEDLELWSWPCDGFREMKCKLFEEYFSIGHYEIPEVGARGQCWSAPLSSPPPASRKKKEKAAAQYLIFRIN